MTTNFFQHIANLQTTGTLNIAIQTSEGGGLTVSVLLTNPKIKEANVKVIPPLLLKGTPEELNEGFFDAILEPIQQTGGLLQNIADYQKAQEKVKSSAKTSSSNKPPHSKDDIEVSPKPNKEEKKKEYIDTIRKITELTALCKYDEALAILPSVEEFPDKQQEITKRRADLERMSQQKQLMWTD